MLLIFIFSAQPYQEWYFNSGTQQVWYGDNLVYENYLGKANIELGKCTYVHFYFGIIKMPIITNRYNFLLA